jgi:hypothetical protein
MWAALRQEEAKKRTNSSSVHYVPIKTPSLTALPMTFRSTSRRDFLRRRGQTTARGTGATIASDVLVDDLRIPAVQTLVFERLKSP